MATRLIFVHGRNQQGKDPTELRRHWFESLRAGFERVGLEMPITEDDVIFPFFGDALHTLTSEAEEESPDGADAVLGDELSVARSGTKAQDDTAQFGREVLTDLLDGAGVPAEAINAEIERRDAEQDEPKPRRGGRGGGMLTWEWVQSGLTILDRFIPGASGASVAYAASDVAQYLRDDSIRSEIDGVVAAAFAQCDPGDSLVVVAHSLGTVIAYDLLAHDKLEQTHDVAALVTVGSPLGVTAIRRAVSPIDHPKSVRQWLNAYDDRDVVALYPLDHRHFSVSPPILNHGVVVNDSNNHHKIEGYLSDPTVALTIHRALTRGRLPPALARRRREQGTPSRVEELRTPALVVDLDVFDTNCAAMGAVRPGRSLRPNAAVFKSTALAKRLATVGHTAFCAATSHEIEGLVAAGLTEDLLLVNETLDTRRIGVLADQAQITVAIDSDDTLDAAILGGVRSVLIDVNLGLPRSGCAPDGAGRLAERARRAGLEVRGVMGYEIDSTPLEGRAGHVESAMAPLLEAAGDVGGDIISGGGTATFATNTWCTEIQAGSYCLMDTRHDNLDLPFSIALEILATVISIQPDGLIIIDAGRQILGSNAGNPRWQHGQVLLSSETQVVLQPDEPSIWSIGDLVRLQSADVGSTVARHRDLWVVANDRIVDRWPVDLRSHRTLR